MTNQHLNKGWIVKLYNNNASLNFGLEGMIHHKLIHPLLAQPFLVLLFFILTQIPLKFDTCCMLFTLLHRLL